MKNDVKKNIQHHMVQKNTRTKQTKKRIEVVGELNFRLILHRNFKVTISV